MKAVFRSREQSIALFVIGVLLSGYFLVGVFQTGDSVNWVVDLLLAGLTFSFFVLRLARSGVYVRGDRLRIVNPLRSLNVPLAEVTHFSIGRHGVFPLVGLAHLEDGTKIGMWGIQAPNPLLRSRNRSAQRIIDELNGLLSNRPPG